MLESSVIFATLRNRLKMSTLNKILWHSRWAKSPKNSLGTQNTVPYCQKYTLTECFFGDFAHWVIHYYYGL